MLMDVSVYSPAMTSTVRYVEVRATEVEIVAARIEIGRASCRERV